MKGKTKTKRKSTNKINIQVGTAPGLLSRASQKHVAVTVLEAGERCRLCYINISAVSMATGGKGGPFGGPVRYKERK